MMLVSNIGEIDVTNQGGKKKAECWISQKSLKDLISEV